jgi:acetyl esterase/lipase
MDAADQSSMRWLPPPDPQYLRQDFTDYLAHRRGGVSDRGDVLRLARHLDVDIRETHLEAGSRSTAAVLIGAPKTHPSPAVLFLHGGGHAFGDAYSQAAELVDWSAELGIQAVSVDYRLSPENPYPAALEDATTALKWLTAHSRHLNISQVYVYGLSAGGGVAASLALRAIESELLVAGLILASPMLDHRTSREPAGPQEEGIYTWNHANNRQAWDRYLGNSHGVAPQLASPGSFPDLPRFPDCYLDVGTRDLFHDEVLAFARKAQASGTDVTLRTWDRGYHGFEVIDPGSRAADAARNARKTWLRQSIGRSNRDRSVVRGADPGR